MRLPDALRAARARSTSSSSPMPWASPKISVRSPVGQPWPGSAASRSGKPVAIPGSQCAMRDARHTGWDCRISSTVMLLLYTVSADNAVELQVARLLAEEFDQLVRPGARLAERYPAMASQSELLTPQHDLLVAIDSNERTVCAVIRQDELVQPAFDLAMRTRGHPFPDDKIGRRVAAQGNERALRRKHVLVALHDEPKLGVLRLVRRPVRCEGRHVLALLPNQFVDRDFLHPALHLHRRDGARRCPQHRRHEHHGIARGDDLSLRRHARKARRHVDGVAEEVAVALDDGTEVEADADADARV